MIQQLRHHSLLHHYRGSWVRGCDRHFGGNLYRDKVNKNWQRLREAEKCVWHALPFSTSDCTLVTAPFCHYTNTAAGNMKGKKQMNVRVEGKCHTFFTSLLDRQCTCNIEKRSSNHWCRGKAIRITYSECGFVALVVQHAMRMRHFMPSVASPALSYFSTLSHKRHDYRIKVVEYKMCVLIFSTTFVSNIFHVKRNAERPYHKRT
jgi:hypothetical protein